MKQRKEYLRIESRLLLIGEEDIGASIKEILQLLNAFLMYDAPCIFEVAFGI